MAATKRRGKRTRKEKVDMLIVNANELITLKDGSERPRAGKQMQSLGIIRKGGLAVKDGRIVAVGKTPEIRKSFNAENVISASGKIVMPGFVDPHTHLVFAGSREDEFQMSVEGVSYLAILDAGGGILRTVRETRRASVERLVEFGFKTLDVMLEHGTTTVEAKSGYGLTLKDELKILGVMKRLNQLHAVDVVPTFLGAHAIPLEYKSNPQEYVNLIIEEMIPRVAEKGLAEFCDVFCEKGVFNLEQTRRVLVAGENRGLKPKVHADEMSMFGGAELAADVMAVSAEHLLFASDEGIKAMADKGVVAVLLPAAAFSLMSGRYADARKMIDFGVPVALGTDFNPSCWVENQQLVIAFACHFMRLTPAEAITAATINSAHAIGRANEVGSLEIGKKADVIVLDVPNHMFLGYRFGVNLVDKVVKNGRLVVDKEASGIKTVGLF
ncbi:MAG: imidazolonepropionase [Candidatus Bathyarchaeota archaeon]|nr:imidazolonepropionase [Candidatus Bathyarchaeota archaeon]